MANIVIADAGPLIALSKIDCLTILKSLFSKVYVVESVINECFAKSDLSKQRIELAINDQWLIKCSPNRPEVNLSKSLGQGETDSIYFALNDVKHALLILDDRLARRYALKNGLNIVGTVRVLVLAEKQGLINSAEECVKEMIETGYRVSLDLLFKIQSE